MMVFVGGLLKVDLISSKDLLTSYCVLNRDRIVLTQS